MLSVFQALGFMFLGGAIVEIFEIRAWRRYHQGKREGQGYLPPIKSERR